MSLVDTRISNGLGVLVINNPPFNALSHTAFQELEVAFRELADNPDVKVIIFTGEGIAFAAGADVKMIHALAKEGRREESATLLREVHEFFFAIDESSKPTIAAVNGVCLGGGLELALACDFIVASSTANTQFGFPEVGLGIIPGLGGTQRTTRRVGPKNAYQLVVTGRPLSPEIAVEIGLIDRVARGELIPAVKEFAAEILEGAVASRAPVACEALDLALTDEAFAKLANGKPAIAAKAAVAAIQEGAIRNLREAILDVEMRFFLDCLFTSDALEGLSAFVEKRAPRFQAVIGQEGSGAKMQEKPAVTASEPVNAEIPPWENENSIMLREAVREFAQEVIGPKVAWMEEHEEVPKELIRQMGELGFYGVGFPEAYGGSGLGKIGVCILADELTYVHPSTAVVLGAHASLACEAVHVFGTEDQKQRYLVPGIEGEKIGAFATTEPDIGSDVGAMKTRAEKVEGGWRLRGTKQFITNGEIADFVIVFAQTDPLGHNKTLAAFIVDAQSPGFQITHREKKMGIHASRTNSIALDNVFVSDANVLGEVGQGFKMAMQIFNHSRISVAASCIGFIRRAIDESVEFSKNRMLFGEPMYMKQNTQLKIAEMEAIRFCVESAVLEAAWRADRGLDVRNEAAAVKYVAAEFAGKVLDTAVQLHGGSGFVCDSPIEMFFRDARVFRLFEGTSEVQLLMLGKEIIKSKVL